MFERGLLRIIHWWWARKLNSLDPKVRCRAATELGDSDVPLAVDWLLTLLKDENHVVRQAAAAALGRTGDVRAIEPLAVTFQRDQAVSASALAALKQAGPVAVQWLEKALKSPDSSRRETATRVLAPLVGTRALKAFETTLRDDDIGVRLAAVTGLSEVGGVPATKLLQKALTDGATEVRQAAALELESLGWQPTDVVQGVSLALAAGRFDEAVCKGSAALEPLVALLSDADAGVRLEAVQALGQLHDTRAVESLVAQLRDCSPELRQTAAEALGRIGDMRATPALVATLQSDKCHEVRKTAAEVLGRIGDARATSALVATLQGSQLATLQGTQHEMTLQERDELFKAAKTSLKGIKDRRHVVELLTKALAERREYCHVADALAEVGGAGAVEALVPLLDHAKFDQGLPHAFEKLGDPSAVMPLLQAYEREGVPNKNDIIKAATSLLEKVQEVEVLEPLLRTSVVLDVMRRLHKVQDDEVWHRDINYYRVRESLVQALERIGGARAVDLLVSLLSEHLVQVRHAAAKALGRLGDNRAIPTLVRTLGDAALTVRYEAAVSLDALGWKPENLRQEFYFISAGYPNILFKQIACLRSARIELKSNLEASIELKGYLEDVINYFKDHGEPLFELLSMAFKFPNFSLRRQVGEALRCAIWQPESVQEQAYWAVATREYDRLTNIPYADKSELLAAVVVDDINKHHEDTRVLLKLIASIGGVVKNIEPIIRSVGAGYYLEYYEYYGTGGRGS